MKTNVIDFPLSDARKLELELELELEDLALLPFPAMPADHPHCIVLDGVARIADGITRLRILHESRPDVMASMGAVDDALGDFTGQLMRLRSDIERRKRQAIRKGVSHATD